MEVRKPLPDWARLRSIRRKELRAVFLQAAHNVCVRLRADYRGCLPGPYLRPAEMDKVEEHQKNGSSPAYENWPQPPSQRSQTLHNTHIFTAYITYHLLII